MKADHICYRYEVLSVLGKGSFGQVVKVYDHKRQRYCAVKIIRNKKRFHHQGMIEVRILKHIRDKDPEDKYYQVRMLDYFYFRNHLCISFELLSINLYEFIKNNNFQGLSLGLIRRFGIQILSALKFMYREHIIHCDLKPENILLRSPNKSSIKIIDMGSSCFENERIYTYIQSRFYRSPEVILGISYGRGIDMWSFGCILAELYTGYPLFPGENEVEQLACIMEVLGVPPKRLVELASRKKLFFDHEGNPRIVPNSRGRKRRPGSKDLVTALRCNDPLFISFLEGCLRWDPRERFTPEDCMKHEWILEALLPPTFRSHVSQPFGDSGNRSVRKRSSGGGKRAPGGGGGASLPQLPSIDSLSSPRTVQQQQQSSQQQSGASHSNQSSAGGPRSRDPYAYLTSAGNGGGSSRHR